MVRMYAQGVASFGDVSAKQYMAELDRALDRLMAFPLSGPAYPGLRMPVRYLRFRSHQIFYDFDGETVRVLRILHHAMDAGRHI